eukprot:scaffold18625_cov15-Tisochrysis_lutea.AAC.1
MGSHLANFTSGRYVWSGKTGACCHKPGLRNDHFMQFKNGNKRKSNVVSLSVPRLAQGNETSSHSKRASRIFPGSQGVCDARPQ